MEVLSCTLCYNEYDRLNHTPYTLADWGHGVCKTCVDQLAKRAYSQPGHLFKCPFCKTVAKNDPKQNYALLNVIDEGLAEKRIEIIIGSIPHFVDLVSLRENFLNRFSTKDDMISCVFENDLHSICNEKFAKITYKDSDKLKHINNFDGKVFTFSNEKMHWMLNVTKVNSKLLNSEVISVLKAKQQDLVMLVPNKPAFGYNISILLDSNLVTKDIHSKFIT